MRKLMAENLRIAFDLAQSLKPGVSRGTSALLVYGGPINYSEVELDDTGEVS